MRLDFGHRAGVVAGMLKTGRLFAAIAITEVSPMDSKSEPVAAVREWQLSGL